MKIFVIEPRHSDGRLDVKSKYWGDHFLTSFWNNATERQVFDYFWLHNKEVDSVGWEECNKWYNSQGLYIREKNW